MTTMIALSIVLAIVAIVSFKVAHLAAFAKVVDNHLPAALFVFLFAFTLAALASYGVGHFIGLWQ